MRSCSFLLWSFFILSTVKTRAQNCVINYEYQPAKLLAKAKVKEIKVQQGNDSTKKLLYHFFIASTGCVDKFLHYDLYSKGTEPIQTTYSVSEGGKRRTFIRGRLTASGFTEYENTIEDYTSSGKLRARYKTETADLETITINRYDTTDYGKIAMIMIRKMPKGDTLSVVLNNTNKESRIYILKNKLGNGWEETEKIITTYRDNEIYEEKFFQKGKLVKTTTKEELSAQKNITLNAGDGSANPLPSTGNPKPDSSYTDNERFSFGIQTSSKKNLKFLIVRFPMLNDFKKTDHYDVFEQKSGLLKKRLSFLPTQSLYFEYILR